MKHLGDGSMKKEELEIIVAGVIAGFAGGGIPFFADWMATMMDVMVAVLLAVSIMGTILIGNLIWIGTRDTTSKSVT